MDLIEQKMDLARSYMESGDPVNEQKAFQIYTELAGLGFPKGMRCLANCYYDGKGVSQDYQQSFSWNKKAAELGDVYAQVSLGDAFFLGNGTEVDKAKAAFWYGKAADAGDAYAQAYLGDMYRTGDGVPQDHTKAFAYFLDAAKGGNVEAQYWAARYLDTGTGTAHDSVAAVSWYRKAAEGDHTAAAFFLAASYMDGDGVEQNSAEAYKWFLKAANDGDSDAQFQVAKCFKFGNGVEEDQEKALFWFEKAAESGHGDALKEVLKVYLDPKKKDPVSLKKSFDFLKIKCEKDQQPEDWFRLALCYRDGEGVPQNDEKSFEALKFAADHGFNDAWAWLVEYYAEGKGTPADLHLADECLQKAKAFNVNPEFVQTIEDYFGKAYGIGDHSQGGKKIESQKGQEQMNSTERFSKLLNAAAGGDPDAQYEVAVCLLQGNGTAKNESESFYWCHKAAEGGHEGALRTMVDYYLDSKRTAPDSAKKGVAFLETLCQRYGKAQDYFRLSVYYAEGTGTPQNDEKAFECYKYAADHGCGDAWIFLLRCYALGKGTAYDPAKAKECLKMAKKFDSDPEMVKAAEAALGGMLEQGKKQGQKKRGLFGWLK